MGVSTVEQAVGTRQVAHRSRTALLLPTLVVLFFLSGMSGLIYQVLWLRMLALIFGVTVYAASAVLASFMSGLALGSYVAGRYADRTRNALLLYGVAEVLVGLSALATPTALAAVERVYVGLSPSLTDATAVLTLVRFVLAFAVLLVPTTLMGATLPIIVKSSLLQVEGLGQRVGVLYATNTAGAIVGTVAAGFYLIGSQGLNFSFQVAAGINVVVGIVAIAASFAFARGAEDEGRTNGDASHHHSSQVSPLISNRARHLVLVVFVLSGFASLALEVVWFRVLVLFLRATTYAFTVMLATFLLGIAVGSYVVTPLMRRRADWLVWLASIEMAIGVVSLSSLLMLGWSYRILDLGEAILRRPLPYETLIMLIASFLAVFPAALLFGMAFPIGLQLWAVAGTDAKEHVAERIGIFYSLNTIGAIVGSTIAGFFLLPWLGSQLSLAVLASVGLFSGLLLLSTLPPDRRGFAVRAGGVGLLLFAAAAITMPNPFDLAVKHRFEGETLLWREEGVQTTVTVNQQPSGFKLLYLDGLHQADDNPAMVAVHRIIGHMPMVLHPQPQDALVIGLGGGATPGAVSQYPGANVDLVELAQSVVNGSEWFRHVNYDLLRLPNVRLRVDDGRNYMLLTPKRYDVITADLIQPVHAGAGNLYSAEYFRLARNVLKEDGIMLQWIGALPETQFKLIMRTFLSVFPETTLWATTHDGDHLLIGKKKPLELRRADLERKLQDPTTREALAAVGITSWETLLEKYRAGTDALHQYVGEGPILTDDRPQVEYFLSLPRREKQREIEEINSGGIEKYVRP
ncbi:MAG: fused MFS/spermidine synthase [Chloroflexi bacterium]|nr:fused MFS/spermidine synthase [Chloroflexota bacterium]